MPIETLLWSLIKISVLPVYFPSQISAETIKMFGGLTVYYCVCPSYDLLKIIPKLKNLHVIFPLIIAHTHLWVFGISFDPSLNILPLVSDQDYVSKCSWQQNYIFQININKEITTGHNYSTAQNNYNIKLFSSFLFSPIPVHASTNTAQTCVNYWFGEVSCINIT